MDKSVSKIESLDSSDDEIVSFDIGGTLFKTKRETLKLSKYFDALLVDWEDGIFIDRSPVLFEHILRYLRDSRYKIPPEAINELDYYGVKYLIQDEIQVKDTDDVKDIDVNPFNNIHGSLLGLIANDTVSEKLMNFYLSRKDIDRSDNRVIVGNVSDDMNCENKTTYFHEGEKCYYTGIERYNYFVGEELISAINSPGGSKVNLTDLNGTTTNIMFMISRGHDHVTGIQLIIEFNKSIIDITKLNEIIKGDITLSVNSNILSRIDFVNCKHSSYNNTYIVDIPFCSEKYPLIPLLSPYWGFDITIPNIKSNPLVSSVLLNVKHKVLENIVRRKLRHDNQYIFPMYTWNTFKLDENIKTIDNSIFNETLITDTGCIDKIIIESNYSLEIIDINVNNTSIYIKPGNVLLAQMSHDGKSTRGSSGMIRYEIDIDPLIDSSRVDRLVNKNVISSKRILHGKDEKMEDIKLTGNIYVRSHTMISYRDGVVYSIKDLPGDINRHDAYIAEHGPLPPFIIDGNLPADFLPAVDQFNDLLIGNIENFVEGDIPDN